MDFGGGGVLVSEFIDKGKLPEPEKVIVKRDFKGKDVF